MGRGTTKCWATSAEGRWLGKRELPGVKLPTFIVSSQPGCLELWDPVWLSPAVVGCDCCAQVTSITLTGAEADLEPRGHPSSGGTRWALRALSCRQLVMRAALRCPAGLGAGSSAMAGSGQCLLVGQPPPRSSAPRAFLVHTGGRRGSCHERQGTPVSPHWDKLSSPLALGAQGRVFHPAVCQVPCPEVFLTRDSSSLLEGSFGCHLTGSHLWHSWDSPYHKELPGIDAKTPGRDALDCRWCWGKEMAEFQDALGISGYHSGPLMSIPGGCHWTAELPSGGKV